MKRLLITIAAMSFIFSEAPDPKGNWKLSGLSVDYLHIARETTPFYLTADYNLPGTVFESSSDCAIRVHPDNLNSEGECNSPEVCVDTGNASDVLIQNPNPTSICIHLQDVPEGVMFNRLTNGPFTNQGLGGIGVNLNVNIYDNGFGTVAQGSFYPDIELSESQECVTDLQIFAVDENFTWELGPQSTFSNSNVLGMDNGLLCDEVNSDNVDVECVSNTTEAWGFGLVTGLFDATPATPVPTKMPPGLPYIALTDQTVLGYSCGAWCAGPSGTGADGAATLAFNGDLNLCVSTCSGWDYATAAQYGFTDDDDSTNDHAPGYLTDGTGTSSKFNLGVNMVDSNGNLANQSTMCEDGWTDGCNPDVDFKLVWNALDSEETGLGFGDDPDVDEDGDGSDFDRIFGVPYLASTTLNTDNPVCDITGGTADGNTFEYALAGDIVSTLGDAGCDDDSAATPCCSELYDTYSGRYTCGENVVAAFITGSCNDQVTESVTGLCEAADGPDEDTDGSPAEFAAGFCMQQIEANLAGCSSVGWQAIVSGVCSGLGVDCSADLGTAQAMFDQICAGAAAATAGSETADLSGAGITTCAQLVTYTGQDQNELECSFLAADFLIDSDADGQNDLPFYAGACSQVVGPIIGALDSNDDNVPDTCSEWVGSFDQAALDGFSTQSLPDPLTCSTYGAGFTDLCLETAGEPNSVNATEVYLLNPGAVPATYGHFVTYNGTALSAIGATAAIPGEPIYCDPDGPDGPTPGSLVAFPGSHPTGDWDGDGDGPDAGDIATFAGYCNPLLVDNDSDHDFDPSCLYDCDDTNQATCGDDCSGRLRLTFEPTCVPEIEARQIVAEFVNLLDICDRDGDVNYSCAAYDWNYNYQADCNGAEPVDGTPQVFNPECEHGIGNGDGVVTAAECEAYATAEGLLFDDNYGYVLPSCDPEEGITENCNDVSGTVFYNHAYGHCGDGDPNDLIDVGADMFCAVATSGAEPVFPSMEYCLGAYAAQEGIPAFEQACTVGNNEISVADVIVIINHIIGNDTTGGQSVNQLGGEAACAADLNADGNINVADVVQLVNNIINSAPGRVADATEASVIIKNDKIVIDADGYVGGVDMIVEFTDNFSFELADGFASDYAINGNKAHIILVGDKNGVSEVLTMTSGKIVNIEEALVVNSSDFVTTSINQPSIFSVGAAYPNPFNPSTNISLVLNANADLSVKVYNLTGQLVDVIAEGNYSPSSYNWTWKAENLASGVYFIRTQVGSDMNTQKVMLLK